MSEQVSAATGRRYPVSMVCTVWDVARSSVYAAVPPKGPPPAGAARPGPKGAVPDEDLLTAIREVLAESPFHGEGHRKVWARLRHGRHQIAVGRKRVLRLMRLHGLLAPVRFVHDHGNPAHEGTIIPERPNEIWGTDATMFWTEQGGWCWFFGAIDHFVGDVVGHNVAKIGNRFEATEPILSGVRRHVAPPERDVARGLAVRSDHGPQYLSDYFGSTLRFLGIRHSWAFVAEPQTNGVAERFMRTLKEQCLHLHRFKNLEEARQIIGEFIERFNREWILERHGYRTPSQVRAAWKVAHAA